MPPQRKYPCWQEIQAVVNRFCSKYRINRNVIATDLGVKDSTFYEMLEGRQFWTHPVLQELYTYMKATNRSLAMQLAQAAMNDAEIYLASEEQMLKDQVFALLSRAGHAFDSGEISTQGALDMSNEAIELAMKLKARAKGK